MGKNNRYWHKKPQRPGSDYKPPYSEDVLGMAVEGLNLSVETLEILQKGGIRTVGDIVVRRKREMFKVQSFNKKKLLEVTNAITPLGVDFRPDEPREDAPEAKGGERANQNGKPREEGARRENRENRERRENRDNRDNRESRENRENRENRDRPENRENRDNRARDGRDRKDRDGREDGNRREQAGQDHRQGDRQERSRDNRRDERQGDRADRDRQNGKKQQGKRKEDNSVDFSKIFPREKLVHSPRIEPVKDRFTKFQRAGKWGYKDENGREVIPPIYTEALNFKEDMAAVEMNGLFGYINRENVLVIPYKYDTAGSFSEGWANVSLGEKCGYVDTTGRETVPFIYDAATPFTGEGYGRVKKDGRWGNITKNGEVSWQ